MKHSGEFDAAWLHEQTLALKSQMLVVSGALDIALKAMIEEGADDTQLDLLRSTQDNLSEIEEIAGDDAHKIEAAEIPDSEPVPDEEETYQIVQRFFARKKSDLFTKAELKAHLRGLNVDVPDDNRTFMLYFDNWVADIKADAAQAGKPVELVDIKEGRQTMHALAEIVRKPQSKTVEAPVSDFTPTHVPAQAPPVVESVAKEETLMAFIVANIHLKAKDIIASVAERSGQDLVAAAEQVSSLQAQGILHKVRRQGTSYYALEAPEIAVKHPSKRTEIEHFDELDQRRAISILEVFMRPKRHVNQRLTASELANEMDVAADEETIKRIGRQLSKLGVTIHGRAKVTGSRNSKAREEFKIGLASRQIRDLLKTDDGWRQLADVMTTGQRLMFDDQA